MSNFQPWARYLIAINTLLVVINSSSNFIFYCGDVVFRECLSAISFGAPICLAFTERLRKIIQWKSSKGQDLEAKATEEEEIKLNERSRVRNFH